MPRLFTALVPLLAVALMGCASNATTTSTDLPPAAADGQQVARNNGCAGCHGSQGEGLVGPPFVGLFGSEVELVDGGTVTADEAYLIESIKDPAAKKVAGYRVPMPTNGLSDDQVDAIVAYIIELASSDAVAP